MIMRNILVAAILAAASVASAELAILAQGSAYAGSTNTSFVVADIALSSPARVESAVFYNDGTNVATVSLSRVDAGNVAALVAEQEVAVNAGYEYVAVGATNSAVWLPPASTLRIAATKTAGATNGAPSSLFYRVYGVRD